MQNSRRLTASLVPAEPPLLRVFTSALQPDASSPPVPATVLKPQCKHQHQECMKAICVKYMQPDIRPFLSTEPPAVVSDAVKMPSMDSVQQWVTLCPKHILANLHGKSQQPLSRTHRTCMELVGRSVSQSTNSLYQRCWQLM